MAVLSSPPVRQNAGSKMVQYLAAITVNFGIICSEMHYGWPSPFLPVLLNGNYTFTITIEEESYLAVIPLLGSIFGAFFTGLIVDVVGRKRMVIFSTVPFLISWLFVGFARSSVLMFVGRFLAGAADGLSFTAVPMYLGEIAEPKTRGFLASVCPVSIVFGILLINILGAVTTIDNAAFISTAIPVLLLLTFSWMPESPYYYVMRGRIDDARRSLQAFRGTENVVEELTRIARAVEVQNASKERKFLDLIRVRSNRKALIIAVGLRTFQQLTGITAFIFFCQKIFDQAKDFLDPSLATIVYFSVQLAMSVLASLTVDFSGRRPLLIASITGTALMLLANGVYLYLQHCRCTDADLGKLNFVPMVSLLCLVVVFSMGLQTVPLLMMGELFPTDVKALALCIVDVYYSLVVTVVSKYFHWSNGVFGMHVPFFTFAACCCVGLVFIIVFVPETKGKTLEDIQMELRGEKRVVDTTMLNEALFY